MPRLTDNIKLSDDLKQIPVLDLIARTKALVETKGFSQRTMSHYNQRFNDLLQNSAQFDTEKLTEEFTIWHIEEGMHRENRHASSSVQRKSLLNLIATALDSASVFTNKKDAAIIQSRILQESLTAYGQHLQEEQKSNDTIISYLQTATKFLIFLDKSKKYDPTKVSAIDVRDFITELGAAWSTRSMQIVPTHLKTYLEFVGAAADTILSASFRVPRKCMPILAMSSGNVDALWSYVESDKGDLRAKAMVTILLVTGMRPVDITGLMLEDINWNSDTISFIQSKTGEHMNIELFPVMGTAIARYITQQRPKGTGEKFVFLTKTAPYRKLVPSSLNRVLKVALVEAGITFVPDKRHCPRAIRRSLVSRMIAKGVPIQKAAASIGHVGEESVDLYAELEVSKMRAICLPIPTPMKGWCVING